MTRRQARRIVALLTVVSALAHGWVIVRAVAPAQDAIRFAHQLRRLREEPFLEVVRSEAQHPLYPLLAAGPLAFLETLRPDAALDNYVLALQITAATFGVLLVPLTYCLARQVVSRSAAVWGTAIFNLSPRVIEVSSDGLSDSLHLFLVAGATYFLCRALLRRAKWTPWILAGAFAGAAYWVRPEGLLVAVAAAPVGLWAILRHRPRWKPFAASLSGVLATCLLLGLFVLCTGRLTTKATANKLLGLSGKAMATRTEAAIPPFAPQAAPKTELATPRREESQATTLPTSLAAPQPRPRRRPPESTGHDPSPRPRSLLAAFREYASELGSAYQYVPLLFCAVGLATHVHRRSRYVVIAFLIVTFAAYTVVLHMLYVRVGYLSMRHVLVPALVLAPTVGAGYAWFVRAVAGEKRRWVAVAVVILMTALFVPRLLQPLHHSRVGAMEAARWLAQHARPGDAVLDLHLLSGAYANLRTYPLARHRMALRDPRLRYVVFDIDDFQRPDPPYSTLIRYVQRRGRLVAVFPTGDPEEPSVLVYELRQRAPRTAAEPDSPNAR